MYSVIDKLDSLTGWSGTGISLNQIEDFISHNNAASILIQTVNGGVYEKSLTIDPTGYEYLSLSIQSLHLGKNEFFHTSDFLHKITFGTTYFYLPVYPTMRQAVFKIPSGETLDKIRIESSGSDSIFISHLQLLKENPVPDLVNSIKNSIDIFEELIGQISLSSGVKSMDISGLNYIHKSTRIRIGSEYHVIDDIENGIATFTDDYDGKSMLSTYTNENVYISCPVEFGGMSKNFISPAIWIWPGDTLPVSKETYFEMENYQVGSPGSVDIRYMSGTYATPVQIQITSANKLFLDGMDKKVKKFLENNRVWVNNNPLNFEIIRTSSIPDGDFTKKVYELVFEHGEKIWTTETQKFPLAGTTNFQITVR